MCPPWLVDRLFRHLLVDLTGNTHRAEFCIDKLFSPDSSSGRLGLVEFRGFEMPPHARMSLTQQLLLRALIARFWKAPYRAQAGALGHRACTTASCCPTSWIRISATCSANCGKPALPLTRSWFRPHSEFRFPLIGEIDKRGVHLELRHAIEPWHVLGEEASRTGTARYVDSSLERLQVKVSRHDRSAARRHLQRPPRAAASHRRGRANMWPACAIAPGSRPTVCIRRSRSMRRWCSTSWTPGISARSGAARGTCRIRAGAAMTIFRSMPLRPKPAARRGSSRWGIRQAQQPSRRSLQCRFPVDARSAFELTISGDTWYRATKDIRNRSSPGAPRSGFFAATPGRVFSPSGRAR